MLKETGMPFPIQGVNNERASRDTLRQITIVSVIVAIIAVLATATAIKNITDQATRQKLMLTADIIATDHESAVVGIRQFLISLSYTMSAVGITTTTCDSLLKRMAPIYPYFLNIGATNATGTVICSGVPLSPSTNFGNDADFKEMRASKEFTTSDYRISQATGRPSVRFLMPVMNADGDLTGSLFVTFGIEWLNGFRAPETIANDVIITKFDKNGTVFMRYPDPTTWAGTSQKESAFFKTISGMKTGFIHTEGLDGVSHLFYFKPIYYNGDISAYVAIGNK